MPAEIETMMYAREIPWHGFGTKVDGLQTAEEAIVAAELDWLVEPRPLYTHGPKGTLVKVPDRLANVRMSDGKPLGVVSPTYKVLQNTDAFRIADEIVKTGEAKYETAGALRGGKVVFLSMELPKTVHVPGDDGDMRPYLLAANSHDGSMAIRFLITLIRVVCANTLSAALGSHQAEIRLRHTTNVDSRVAEAQRALGLTFDYLDEFEAIAEKMLLQKVSERDVLRVMAQVFPIKDVNPLKLNASELRRILSTKENADGPTAKALRMYETSPNIANVKGTGWAVYNAVTEYIDYGMSYRSREVPAADNRARSILLGGQAAQKKQKAADLVLALN